MKTYTTVQSDPKKIMLWIIGSALALTVLLSSFYSVSSTQRGIIATFGKINPTAVDAGLHVKIPFVQSIDKMSIQTVKMEQTSMAYTKDIQSSTVTYVLNFDPVPESVAVLYRNVGSNYIAKIITPVVEGVLKDVIGNYNAADIVSNREEVRKGVESELSSQLPTDYVRNVKFQLVNIDYDDAFEQSIVDKQVAEQKALTAKNNTIRIQEEANQKVISAEAEAKAMQIKANALRANPDLTQYEAVQKWDGKMPNYMLGNSVPFISLPK